MIKKILKKIIQLIRSNVKIKSALKGFTIRHPKLTSGLLKIYRRNIPEVIVKENMARLAVEEMDMLTLESKAIYERLKKDESIT